MDRVTVLRLSNFIIDKRLIRQVQALSWTKPFCPLLIGCSLNILTSPNTNLVSDTAEHPPIRRHQHRRELCRYTIYFYITVKPAGKVSLHMNCQFP